MPSTVAIRYKQSHGGVYRCSTQPMFATRYKFYFFRIRFSSEDEIVVNPLRLYISVSPFAIRRTPLTRLGRHLDDKNVASVKLGHSCSRKDNR